MKAQTGKVMRIGKVMIDRRAANIFVQVSQENGRVSFSGVIGPLFGQINMEFAHRKPEHDDKRYGGWLIQPEQITFAEGWNREKWWELLELWRDWHLNDMRAGCEHQKGPEWDKGKSVQVVEFRWSEKFHKARKRAQGGEMSVEEYQEFQSVAGDVLTYTTGMNAPKYAEHPEIARLLAAGWITAGKTEEKTAGWVRAEEHPEGLLMKACPVCGYKYGSAWRFEAVPDWVIEKINAYPPADLAPGRGLAGKTGGTGARKADP